MTTGGLERGRTSFAESVWVGRRFGDLDLVSMSRLGEGLCLVMRGRGPAGVALLDEVTVGVTSGAVSPMYAGIAYCSVIGGLRRTVRPASHPRVDHGAHPLVRCPARPRPPVGTK